MICLRCRHYTHPDREMDRVQGSEQCACTCHPWNKKPPRLSVVPPREIEVFCGEDDDDDPGDW